MEVSELPKDKKIILFDGVCNLCDAAVQFVIEHDKQDVFRFVSLQSELGAKIMKYLGIDVSKMDSIVLYDPGKAYYYKSEAAFKILKETKSIYKLLLVFSILPASFSNYIYDYVAKNRYRWFGKKDSCMIPSAEIMAKFL